MILLESHGEVDRHRAILTPFNPALQTELPVPWITLNIFSAFGTSYIENAYLGGTLDFEVRVTSSGILAADQNAKCVENINSLQAQLRDGPATRQVARIANRIGSDAQVKGT